MKNILIINQSHTTNVGDKAIGIALEDWVSGHDWNPITLPFWEEKDVFGPLSYTKVSAAFKSFSVTADYFVGKWVRTILQEILVNTQIDYAIIGGGELFSAHRGFNAVFSCWVNELIKNDVPCCVIGVSGGEMLSKAQIKRNKDALRKCSFVGVRDGYSQEVFEHLYGIKVTNVPDAVFLLGDKMNEYQGLQKQGVVCVPIKGYRYIQRESSESEIDYYYNIIESYRKTDEHVVVTTTEKRDQTYAGDLCAEINRKYNTNYEFVPYKEVAGFCSLLSRTRVVISGRMHAMILGLLCGDSIIPVPIGMKLKKFNEEYGSCESIDTVIMQAKHGFEKYAEIISEH